MRLNVLTVLKSIKGNDLLEPNEEGEAEVVTLRTVLVNALIIPVEKDTGVQKVEKFALAMDIQKNDELDITPEQAVLLKEVIAKPYGPVVVGPVWAILDSKDTE